MSYRFFNLSTGRALFAAGAMSIALTAQAGRFEPQDVEICPFEADVIDPEFSADGAWLAFVTALGQVRVAAMRDDGTVDAPDCAGDIVDSGSVWTLPDITVRQGPEWGLSVRGNELFHTKLLPDGRHALARVWRDADGWRQQVLRRGEDRGMQVVSKDADDPQSRLMYLRITSNGKYRPSWRESTQPFSEARLKVSINADSGGVPRWVPGRRQVSTALPDAAGQYQAALVNIDDGSTRLLTTGPTRQDEIWLWQAPEFGGDWAMITVEDACCLVIYRETNDVFTEVNRYDVQALTGRQKLYSPEPTVIGDRSYIAFQASNFKLDTQSQIWIVAADPAAPLARQVSAPDVPAWRIEPEWLVTPSGVYVYYTEFTRDQRSSLRRTNTGLDVPAR